MTAYESYTPSEVLLLLLVPSKKGLMVLHVKTLSSVVIELKTVYEGVTFYVNTLFLVFNELKSLRRCGSNMSL